MGRDSKGVDDLMAFGQQFWDSWSAFAQGIQPGQTPSWGAPASAFGQFASGLPGEARHAVESLSEQGRQFFQFMQDVAGRMGAGDGLGAADVAALWRRRWPMATRHWTPCARRAARARAASSR